MKKTLVLLLVLAVGGLAVSYCGRSSRSSDTDSPTLVNGTSLAAEVGDLMLRAIDMDTVSMDKMGISSIIPAIAVLSVPAYTDGWWTFTHIVTESGTTVVYNIRTKAFDAEGSEITYIPAEGQSNTKELRIIASVAWGSNLTYQFGTEASPLIFDGVGGQSDRTLTGPARVTVTTSDGHSYSVTLIYSFTLLDENGFPTEGANSPSFSFSSSYYDPVSASINYTDYHEATITYSAPLGLSSTSYRIDLVDGEIL